MMRLRSILTAVLALSAFTSAAQSRHPSPDSGPATFGGGTYSYDAAGNIIAIDAQTFLYNPEGSLKQATVMAPDLSLVTQTYTYDVYGNLQSMVRPNVSQTFSVDTSSNHLTNTGAVYEGGNLKEWMPPGTSTTYQYGWDALGNLQTLRLASQPASAPPAVAYLYTASDERISTFDVPNAASHWSIRDLGGQVLSDFVDSGSSSWSWTRDYFYRDGAMLASALPNILQHYTLDHLGTPRLITDDQTRQIAAQTFLPFGEELQATFADGASIKKFTGHERDSDIGLTGTTLDYMHARYYGGMVGHFLSVDPVLHADRALLAPQMWNRYAYALNNPLVYTDPTGATIYIVTYTVGNDSGDDEFRRAAMTRAAQIRGMKSFDSKKDKVLLSGVRNKADFDKTLSSAKSLGSTYGKVGELSMFSHAGPTDGPTFHHGVAPLEQFSTSDLKSMSVDWEWWGNAKFFGCNSGLNFTQRFANAQGVGAYGFTSFAGFSGSLYGWTPWSPWGSGPLYMVQTNSNYTTGGFAGAIKRYLGINTGITGMERTDPGGQ